MKDTIPSRICMTFMLLFCAGCAETTLPGQDAKDVAATTDAARGRASDIPTDTMPVADAPDSVCKHPAGGGGKSKRRGSKDTPVLRTPRVHLQDGAQAHRGDA